MTNRSPFHYPDIGVLGEELVAQWLKSQGWVILHRRWRWRWGEIDIIARNSSPFLAFVEVKTRSRGNWDAGGLLSITSQKQAKLYKSAQCFLSAHPHLGDYPCRFDVALVCCQRLSKHHKPSEAPATLEGVQLGQTIISSGYQLSLQVYLPSAFDGTRG